MDGAGESKASGSRARTKLAVGAVYLDFVLLLGVFISALPGLDPGMAIGR